MTIVASNKADLEMTKKEFDDQISIIPADITIESERENLMDTFIEQHGYN